MTEYKVVTYIENGKDIFYDWLIKLKDMRAKSAIYRVLDRIKRGKSIMIDINNLKNCRNYEEVKIVWRRMKEAKSRLASQAMPKAV